MLYYASEFLSTRDASSSPVTCTFGAAVNWLFMPYMTHRKCSCDVFVVIPPCGARRFQYSTNHFAYYEQLVYAGTSIAVPILRYHRAITASTSTNWMARSGSSRGSVPAPSARGSSTPM